MRLKKKYMAIIVAAMVVLTAVLATSVVGSVQGSRVAYMAVSADKASYGMNENVTFKLKPLTPDIPLTIVAMYDGGGVRIIRLPDTVNPETTLNDYNFLNNLMSWRHYDNTAIPIPKFNSTDETVELSWNGTLSAYDRSTNLPVWGKATAGYYLIYPECNWYYDHPVKFMLDRSSIFYYDSLRVATNLTVEGDISTITTDLTLPEGSAPMSGNISCFVPASSHENMGYHNFTINLKPGVTTSIVISYAIPSSWYSMDAAISTPEGSFLFGFWQSYYRIGATEGYYLVQY